MALTLDEMKVRVLRVLKKDPDKPGQYTDDRVHSAVNEATDFVTSKMMEYGEGFTTKIVYLDSVALDRFIELPAGIVLINQVKYKDVQVYLPLTYSEDRGHTHTISGDEVGQAYPSTYKIVENKLYFDPPFQTTEAEKLMIEGTFYSPDLIAGTDTLPAQMDKTCEYVIQYQAASILSNWSRNYSPPWQAQEAKWYNQLQTILTKRNNQVKFITEFRG